MSPDPQQRGAPPAFVERGGEALTQFCLALGGGALLCIVLINGANVTARYLFGSPFSWAEELMLFLMILSVFAGAIAMTWRNAQIRIDTFVDMLSPTMQRVVRLLGALISIAVILVIVYASARIVMVLHKIDQRSDALELPSWIPQSFLTLGLSVIALLIAVRAVLALVWPPAPQQQGDNR